MSDLLLSDVSLRARGRRHTAAAAVIGAWVLVGIGIVIARALGAPVSWWVVVHAFTLGALTTAIIVYSTHFVEALTRTAATGHRGLAVRVGLLQVATALLIAGRAGYDWGVPADLAAGLVIAVMVWHIATVRARLRRSLSGRFAVTVPYYLAAAAFLIVAIGLAILAGHGVGNYSDLIAAHSRATIWGFAWLTVLGTVVTLLPTLSSTPISPTARRRCVRVLVVHCVGLAAVLATHALGLPGWAGMFQLLVVLAAVLVLQPVLTAVLAGGARWTSAALGVVAGLLWLVALSAADAVSVLAGADARTVTLLLAPAFLGGGLLQLVTGVLHHLLPTLIGGGPDEVDRGRAAADRGGHARLVLINLGALLTLLATAGPARTAGLILLGLGLATHVVAVVVAVTAQYRLETT